MVIFSRRHVLQEKFPFRKQIRFDIYCESSALQMINKEYQNLFASKMMKDDVNLSSAAVTIVAFRVNIQVTALENRKKIR